MRVAPHRTVGGHSNALASSASRTYFLLRRWTRVRLSSLRCFFFAIRLRRFLITEPTTTLAHFSSLGVWAPWAHTTYEGPAYPPER